MAADRRDFSIDCHRLSKKFGTQYVLRHFTTQLRSGVTYGVRGRNGSGKSTLVRLLAGQLSPSRGSVKHLRNGVTLPREEVYRHLSWTGPYIDIMEELTLAEQLSFHFRLKPLLTGLTTDDLLARTELTPFADRRLADCSSGMRQRILLATALYANTDLLLLDEPTLTLDGAAAAWFQRELEEFGQGRLVVIASNDPADLVGSTETIDL